MELTLPMNYVELEQEEMMYLDGGFISVSKGTFKAVCVFGTMAAFTFLSGGISVAGLRTVLGSYSLRAKLVSTIVKSVGVIGIKIGNALQSKLISTIASASLGDFFGSVFDKYIDGMDGSINGAIKIF